MVFLRLTVKIYPREQLQSTSSFSFRSILSSDRDDTNRSSSGSTSAKPANFLIVLECPEEVTLGGLAGMIQDKWRKLRPNAEPLEIKKLLDDDHDTDDLDADMTVADVFVDNGLSQRDSRDQRGTVRVIQKPSPYAPPRFPSVSLDWDAAAQDYDRQVQTKKEAIATSIHKFPPIPEEDSQDDAVAESRVRTPGNDQARRDTPVKSVEKDDEILGSPPRWREQSNVHEEDSQDHNQGVIAATPQHKRMESQELGDSPTPTRPSTLRTYGRVSTSQPRIRRSANRTISRIESESKSPSPTQEDANEFQTLPGRRKTRSQSQHVSRKIDQMDHDQGEEENQNENDEGDKETEDDSEGQTDDDDDDDEAEEEEEESEKEQDEDSDVAMEDSDAAVATSAKEGQQPSDTNDVVIAEAAEKDARNGDPPENRLRKRKNNQDYLPSNKEPRLDKPGNPTASKDKDVHSTQETEPRSSSPISMRKRERAPSFSGPGRRPSITDILSSPKPGLGLGITKSPPRKKPAKLDFLLDSTEKGEPPSSQPSVSVMITPAFSSSAPTAHRESLTQDNSTPSKTQTSAVEDKAKSLHSALRKDSPADKPSGRSVSFAEGDKVIPDPGTKSKSTTQSATQESKRPSSDKIVYPISDDRVKQMMEEVNAKWGQKHEYERKIKEAEDQNADPKHLSVLRDMDVTWSWILQHEGDKRKTVKDQVAGARDRMPDLQKELEKFEAKMKGPSKQPKKEEIPKPAENNAQETPSSAKGTAKKASAGGREGTPKEATPRQSTPEQQATPAPEPSSTKGSGKKIRAGGREGTPKQATPEQATPALAPSSSAKAKASAQRTRASNRETTPNETSAGGREGTPKETTPRQPTPTQQDTPAPAPTKELTNGTTPPEETLTNGDVACASKDSTDDGPAETASQPQKKLSPINKVQNKQLAPVSSARTRRSAQMVSKATEGADKLSEPEPQPEPDKPQEPEKQAEPELQPELELEKQPESEPQQEPQPEPQQEPELQSQVQSEPRQQQQPSLEQPQSQQEPSQKLQEPQQPQQRAQVQELQRSQKEPPQSSTMSDDGKLPEMQTIRSIDQSKDPNEPATGPESKPPPSQQAENESSSSEEETESESESGSGSEDSSDDSSDEDEEEAGGKGPELTKTGPLRQPNGASSARNSMTKSPAPPQSQPLPQNRFSSPYQRSLTPSASQPQPHTQGFRPINRSLSSARGAMTSLKTMLSSQKQEHDARLQQVRQASTQKKDIFDAPSDSESEDESDSDSDSDNESNSSADDGDIQPGGTVGKLRHAVRKK